MLITIHKIRINESVYIYFITTAQFHGSGVSPGKSISAVPYGPSHLTRFVARSLRNRVSILKQNVIGPLGIQIRRWSLYLPVIAIT